MADVREKNKANKLFIVFAVEFEKLNNEIKAINGKILNKRKEWR